jgi:hypothetical protein
MMRALMLTILLALSSASAQPQSHRAGSSSVSSFGARCDGTSDDTSAFQAAANAAHNLYVSTGKPQPLSYSGICVIKGTVNVSSGVHLNGGGQILVPKQIGTTFYVTDADDVAFILNRFTVIDSGPDSPYNAVIGWFSTNADASTHRNLDLENNEILGSAWAISVVYIAGSGSLSHVQIHGNTIRSQKTYTNWDGIHVGGRVSDIVIDRNHVSGRGDAAIALTSEMDGAVLKTPTMATVAHNVLYNNIVNLDDSGAHDTKWLYNRVTSDTPCPGAQSTAFRQIFYNDYPVGAQVHGNYFFPCDNKGTSPAAKIDPKVTGQYSWPDLRSTFTQNTIDGANAPLYIRGIGINIEGNTFNTAGVVTLDYDGGDDKGDTGLSTRNIHIGNNKWMGSGSSLHLGAGCALYNNITIEPQSSKSRISFVNLGCLGGRAPVGQK